MKRYIKARSELSDQEIKELISVKLLRFIPDYAAQNALRSIIFSPNNSIDWQDAYEQVKREMPETR